MNATHTIPAAGTQAVPFVRLDRDDPELMEELLAEVRRVAEASAFILGDHVEGFERDFAAYCETQHAIGVGSGTDALAFALQAVGVGAGDEVIVPANTFIATAEAVSLAGAKPKLVDPDPFTGLLTADRIAAAMSPSVRCIMPVHLYGATVDMDPIMDLARARGRAGDRGRLPGARRPLQGPPRRVARHGRLLQLLPGQEPRRLGRRRCRRHERRRARRPRPAPALARRAAPLPPPDRGHHEPARRPPGRGAAGQAAPAGRARTRGAGRLPRRCTVRWRARRWSCRCSPSTPATTSTTCS